MYPLIPYQFNLMGSALTAIRIHGAYYVEKDTEKYKQIIEELYPKVKDAQWLNDPLPEIYTRLAKIRTEEGDTEEALRLYEEARDFLSARIQNHPFFGDRNIMKWLIGDVYSLRPFDPEDFSLYDLFYLLQKPAKVRFLFEARSFEVESVEKTGECAVHFDEKWFHTVDDFFAEAQIDEERIWR